MKHVPLKLFIALAMFFHFSTSYAQLKVACVGNSITAGSRLNGAPTYPEQLQKLLDSAYKNTYTVRNFGHSGATVQKGTPISYWEQTVYKNVIEWQPDIVIIKLGTNDAKDASGYWQNEKKFYDDYVSFINTFKQLPTNPTIYVCYPIPVFKDKQYDIREYIMTGHIIPSIKKIAHKHELNLIDLHTPLYGRMDLIYKEHDKEDLIHPNGEGAKFIAEQVFKMMIK